MVMGKENKGWPGWCRVQSGQREAASRAGEASGAGRGAWGAAEQKRGQKLRGAALGAAGEGPARQQYLRKACSGVGPRLGWAVGPSEKTSTRRFPAPAGAGGAAGGGAARSPRRSAEGEGVDYKRWG